MRVPKYLGKKWLFFCLLFFLFTGCNSDRNKDKYRSTVNICKKLYVETFAIIGGGAYGSDRVSDYLTDSINFRNYIGTYDNNDEGYSYKCVGDSITIYKVTGRSESKNKIVSTTKFSLLNLKKDKKFE